jgi:hypothetical protein
MGFPLLDIVGIGAKLIDKLIPDPKAKAEAMLKLKELEQAGDLAQLNADLAVMTSQSDINKIEAASPDRFVAGWRPFIGWVCGSALAVQLVLMPLGMWGAELAGHPVQAPRMETELLTTMVISMLGLSGMRSFEKMKGVAAK